MYTLLDRGFDRGTYRFHVIAPVGSFAVGAPVETDRGAFAYSHSGPRSFERNGVQHAYHYLDVTPADVGAPVDCLTPEQTAARAATRDRLSTATAERRRLLAADPNALVPADQARRAELVEKRKASHAKTLRIRTAAIDTLTPDELDRRLRWERVRAESKVRLAKYRRLISKRPGILTAEEQLLREDYLSRISRGTKKGMNTRPQKVRDRVTKVTPTTARPAETLSAAWFDYCKGWLVTNEARAIRGQYADEAAALQHVALGVVQPGNKHR
jgi:hypothetical protein